MAGRSLFRRSRAAQFSGSGFTVFVVVAVLVTAGVAVWRSGIIGGGGTSAGGSDRGGLFGNGNGSSPASPTPGTSPSPAVSPTAGPINTFPGLTTFRGNATRSYYGEGPLPKHPVVRWQYPDSGGMCSQSSDGAGTRTWCGTGWTGQPNVIPHPDGTVEVREGAYDAHYHFWNGETGAAFRPDLVTGDLAKGSATSDPEGFPLYYAGSRDNQLRVIAMDRKAGPKVLWQVDANSSVPRQVWNDDWDGAPLAIGDYLLEGGENSWFYVIRLNRGYNDHHKVTVDPKIVLTVPGYDDQLFSDVGDEDVGIENSVAFWKGVVYFSNSGGLVQGWDIRGVLKGGTEATRVFRFWTGDNNDGSIVIDQDGFLYVARHREHNVTSRVNPFADTLGDLIKLDPRKPKTPVVWSARVGSASGGGDILGTPALYQGTVYIASVDGDLVAVNAKNGKIFWTLPLTPPVNGSPVPIDGRLLIGDCDGNLRMYRLQDNPRLTPKLKWTLHLEGCIESTPAVWHGWVWVGARGGKLYGIADQA